MSAWSNLWRFGTVTMIGALNLQLNYLIVLKERKYETMKTTPNVDLK